MSLIKIDPTKVLEYFNNHAGPGKAKQLHSFSVVRSICTNYAMYEFFKFVSEVHEPSDCKDSDCSIGKFVGYLKFVLMDENKDNYEPRSFFCLIVCTTPMLLGKWWI